MTANGETTSYTVLYVTVNRLQLAHDHADPETLRCLKQRLSDQVHRQRIIT